MDEESGKETVVEMEIFNIPEEVYYENIFPFLDSVELMQLRLVSKHFHYLSSDYLRNHPEVSPLVEINEADKPIQKFLELDIPTNKVFLNNNQSGVDYFEKYDLKISTFLEDFGPWITEVKLSQMSRNIQIDGKEWNFFKGLPNLKSLEVNDWYDAAPSDGGNDSAENSENVEDTENIEFLKTGFPEVFKSLKKLKIGLQTENSTLNVVRNANLVQDFCPNLEYCCLPFRCCVSILVSDDNHVEIKLENQPGFLGDCFRKLEDVIWTRPKLKCYDFQNYYSPDRRHENMIVHYLEQAASHYFLNMLYTCVRSDVKLMNVHGAWFFSSPDRRDRCANGRVSGDCVLSLLNLHPSVVFANLPNLTTIDIRATSRSSVPNFIGCPDWPNLRTIKIVVDSPQLDLDGMYWNFQEMPNGFITGEWCMTNSLFRFLFSGVSHPKVEELSIVFKPKGVEVTPNIDDIVASCPNLKRLTIVNWNGRNKFFCKLWRGFPELEEITLESCRNLGNFGFIGRRFRSPAFLNLKHLKKLSLKGLDEMPKITHALFRMVLRKMHITCFTLSSSMAIKNVTKAGIQSLLGGRFADSIEDFAFKGWTLASCSEEDFFLLASRFMALSERNRQ